MQNPLADFDREAMEAFMLKRNVVVLTGVAVAALVSQSVGAQASAPVTRAERKAETAELNKAGKLTPAGQGGVSATPSTTKSSLTRADRKAQTVADAKSGNLTPAGQGGVRSSTPSGGSSTVSRSQRKAETAALNKSGKLAKPGEGPGAPLK